MKRHNPSAVQVLALRFCLAIACVFCLGSSANAAIRFNTSASHAQRADPQPTGRLSAPDNTFRDRYQTRAEAAQAIEGFEGGGVGIYIGGSAVTAVLVLLLLIIIL